MKTARVLLACLIPCLALSPALAGADDGEVLGVSKIVDSGPAAERFNLVLLSEGYTEGQLEGFADDAQAFADFLLETPPFATNCSVFNVWRIDIASDQAGADDPAECEGGSGTEVATFLDAAFCRDGEIRRLLGVDNAAAIDVLNDGVPEWDQALVIVNSEIYGGSGGSIGTASLAGPWKEVAIHEFGHAAFGLADEYDYWAGCGTDTDRDMHPGNEPVADNVTTQTESIKWSALIDEETPIPTMENPDCTQCDRRDDPTDGEVGLFEGAHYYHCDAYRPVHSCMMRNFEPFCPVCTARILEVLEPFQPENTAPECDAGGPYVEECQGETTAVELDGSESSDVDCDELTFEWSGEFVEETAEGETATVHFGLGDFVVDLDVSDDDDTSSCEAEVTVEDTTPPSIVAPDDIEKECTSPDGTPVDLGEPTVADVCDAEPEVGNDAPELFPLGETVVTWVAEDDSGNTAEDEQLVTIVDTTPPELALSVSPTELWPPNHKMQTVVVEIEVSDICDAEVTVTLLSIESNEPDNGRGDGNTVNDIQDADFGTDDRVFSLRAERSGNGEGRNYTITYAAEDDSGNRTMRSAVVHVPHDRGGDTGGADDTDGPDEVF